MSGAQGRAWASLDRDVAFLRGQRVGGDVRKDELLSCCTEEERVSGVTDQRRKPGRTSLSGEMRCKQKKKKKKSRLSYGGMWETSSGGGGEARESDAMGAVKQGRRTSQREASSQQRQRQPGSVRDRGLGSRLLGSADQKENVGEPGALQWSGWG